MANKHIWEHRIEVYPGLRIIGDEGCKYWEGKCIQCPYPICVRHDTTHGSGQKTIEYLRKEAMLA